MPRPEPRTGAHGLVLAAGAGRRFGGGKLVAPLCGKPLIAWSLESALAANVDRVIVVLGCDADAVEAALAPYAGPRLEFAVCPDWREGMAASLRYGVAALPDGCPAALVLLGDMPVIDPAIADVVLGRVLAGAVACQPSFEGRPGHPVALSRTIFGSVATLRGDVGARALLRGTAALDLVPTDDPGCVLDADTAADHAMLVSHIARQVERLRRHAGAAPVGT